MAELKLTLDLTRSDKISNRLESYEQLLEIAVQIQKQLPRQIKLPLGPSINLKVTRAEIHPDHNPNIVR